MRIVKTKVYKFTELSETAKQKVIEQFADINTDCMWWDCTYEDAKNVLLTIKGFDLDRMYCQGEFIEGAEDTANKIITEHGENCETYKTAQNYIKDRAELVKKHSAVEDNLYEFDDTSKTVKQPRY